MTMSWARAGRAPTLWLGLRLSLGSGRAGIARTVLMAAGAAIGTLVVLAALAGSAAYGKQYEKQTARSAVRAVDTVVPGQGRVTGLTFGGGYDGIGGRQLIRVAVGGATPGSPRPPGLAAYPGPGEAVVSPALAELLGTDGRARARFPQRVVGLIGDAGLVAPDELYAYVGVPDDDPYLVGHAPVTGFRDEAVPWTLGPSVGDAFTPERMTGVFFALFVLVPFGVFLAVCARLSASTRDRRIAALRLLGVSARQAALVNAVETGVVAGAGTLVGYGLFRMLVPLSQTWHLGRLRWYPADLALPVPVVALVLVATVGYAVAVGVIATRPARVAPLRIRRDAPAQRPTLWRLVPLAAGIAFATVATLGSTEAALPRLAYPVALVLVGISLPIVVPVLTWFLAGLALRLHGVPVSLQLAAARLRHSPGVAPRLVASLAAAVYVAGVGSIGATLLIGNLSTTQVTVEAAGVLVYQTTVAEPGLQGDLERAGAAVLHTTNLPAVVDGQLSAITMADCHTITTEYELGAGESCVDGSVYRVAIWAEVPALPAGAGIVDADNRWSFPAPAATLHLTPKLGFTTNTDVVITPSSPLFAGAAPAADPWAFVVVPDGDAGERLYQLVSARTPANSIQGKHDVQSGVDSRLIGTLLAAGLVVGVGLGVAAFAVAAADRTAERRRENAMLGVVGTPGRVVAASEIAFAAVPLVTGLVLATAGVIGMTLVLADLLEVGRSTAMALVRPALLLGVGALVIGLVLVTVPALVRRRITAETLRRT